MNKIIGLIIISLITISGCSENKKGTSYLPKEVLYSSPEESLPLLEKSLNDNDKLGFVALAPIQYEQSHDLFYSNIERTGGLFNFYNTYFSYFDSDRELLILNSYLSQFNRLKSWIVFSISENSNLLNQKIQTKDESDILRKKIEEAFNKKIKIELLNIDSFNSNKIYGSDIAKAITCKVSYVDDSTKNFELLLIYQKVENQWRYISCMKK